VLPEKYFLENPKKRRAAPAKKALIAGAPVPTEDTDPVQPNSVERPFIVGIGASAGGLEALSQLFPNLPKNLGLTYVVVQHLSPTYRSMMSQLLGRETTMPVRDIEDGTKPEPNTVYITPPNRNITMSAGRFRLVEPAKESLPKPSVNLFFASLAEEAAESCIGIILSGTGSDGAAGIHAIKAAGGFTFSQDPSTAKYNGMPQSAIDTGSVDWILPPENMGSEISLIVQNHGRIPIATQAASAPANLKTLLAKVRGRTKVDFSQYKEPTLWRRIERRMAANHVTTLQEYLALADEKPVELDKLCKDILISVTSFFRDTEAFAACRPNRPAMTSGSGWRVVQPGKRRTRWRFCSLSTWALRLTSTGCRYLRPTSIWRRWRERAAVFFLLPALLTWTARASRPTLPRMATGMRSTRTCVMW
jgi:two-component system CheB/CheR fusion protein